jgi:hypothetical protein
MGVLGMIPGVSTLKMIGVGLASALVAGSLVSAYTALVTVPAAERVAAALARAEAERTYDLAVEELSDEVDKAVVRAGVCRSNGGRWLPGAGRCVGGQAQN